MTRKTREDDFAQDINPKKAKKSCSSCPQEECPHLFSKCSCHLPPHKCGLKNCSLHHFQHYPSLMFCPTMCHHSEGYCGHTVYPLQYVTHYPAVVLAPFMPSTVTHMEPPKPMGCSNEVEKSRATDMPSTVTHMEPPKPMGCSNEVEKSRATDMCHHSEGYCGHTVYPLQYVTHYPALVLAPFTPSTVTHMEPPKPMGCSNEVEKSRATDMATQTSFGRVLRSKQRHEASMDRATQTSNGKAMEGQGIKLKNEASSDRKASILKIPVKPRKPPSSYILFRQENRDKLSQLDCDSAMSTLDRAAEIWKSMKVEEKRPYMEKQLAKRIQYEKDLEAYNERNPEKARTPVISYSQEGRLKSVTPVEPAPVCSKTNVSGSVGKSERSGVFKTAMFQHHSNHNERDTSTDESDTFDEDDDFYPPFDFI